MLSHKVSIMKFRYRLTILAVLILSSCMVACSPVMADNTADMQYADSKIVIPAYLADAISLPEDTRYVLPGPYTYDIHDKVVDAGPVVNWLDSHMTAIWQLTIILTVMASL